MKIGKVFDKLAAKKSVEAIRFYDEAGNEVTDKPARCVVYLNKGFESEGASNMTCKSAHEARLFIDAAKPAGTVPVPATQERAPAPVVEEQPVVEQVEEEEEEIEADNDNSILVSTDWVRERTMGMMELPDTEQVRVSPRTMAALALMKIAA